MLYEKELKSFVIILQRANEMNWGSSRWECGTRYVAAMEGMGEPTAGLWTRSWKQVRGSTWIVS